jgi:hypothetical protein
MRRRRVGVVGTVINDTIHSPTGQVTHALGGILYTILPLRVFLPANVEIVPVLHVGRDLHERVLCILRDLPNVSARHVRREERDNNRVDLHYHSAEERTEVATGRVSPIRLEELAALGRLDILVMNFISGWELSFTTMKRIPGTIRARVHADLHSLLLGRSPDGRRYPRRPYGWKKWLSACRRVQVNEREAMTLTGVKLADSGNELVASLEEASDRIHACGPEEVAITLGARGAFLSVQKGQGKPARELKCGERIERIVDPTGSGDVFLAAFTASTLLGRDARAALAFAVRASALSTAAKGAECLYDYFRQRDLRP